MINQLKSFLNTSLTGHTKFFFYSFCFSIVFLVFSLGVKLELQRANNYLLNLKKENIQNLKKKTIEVIIEKSDKVPVESIDFYTIGSIVIGCSAVALICYWVFFSGDGPSGSSSSDSSSFGSNDFKPSENKIDPVSKLENSKADIASENKIDPVSKLENSKADIASENSNSASALEKFKADFLEQKKRAFDVESWWEKS